MTKIKEPQKAPDERAKGGGAKEPEKASQPVRRSGLSGRVVYIILILMVSVGILVWRQSVPSGQSSREASNSSTSADVITKPKIGGAFTLVNQNGKTVTDADFRGQYMLVYFGYTFCPDVCPTSLSVMADAMDLIGDKASRVTPIFITVDPKRDTVEQMKMYVEYFHPRLVGLTGSEDQVAAAAQAYKVYYAKAGDAKGDEYLMDHSSITYLMGPDGDFIAHFSHGVDAEEMAKRLTEIVK